MRYRSYRLNRRNPNQVLIPGFAAKVLVDGKEFKAALQDFDTAISLYPGATTCKTEKGCGRGKREGEGGGGGGVLTHICFIFCKGKATLSPVCQEACRGSPFATSFHTIGQYLDSTQVLSCAQAEQ